MFDPDNYRRKSRDWSAEEADSDPRHDAQAPGKFAVSASAASSAHPVFAKRGPLESASPAGRPARGSERLQLVPVASASPAVDSRERVARVFHALADHVIPRLLRYHELSAAAREAMKPTEAEFEEFFGCLLQDDEPGMIDSVGRMRGRGMSLEAVYLELLVPSAVRMGQRWVEDCSDFVAVTVAVGRLHQFVRRTSAEFCAEVEPRWVGRRVLLAQPDNDVHMFGLSLVAEFFRREGWDVVGGVAGSGQNPAQRVREEWFDAVGLSLGSELRLPWLRDCISVLRQQSCNADLVVMVGGPLFTLQPQLVGEVGADLTADAASAARRVEAFIAERESSRQPPTGSYGAAH